MPAVTGTYKVGAIDVEVPVEEPRLISDAVFKDTKQPAFELETVLFTLYYPATPKGWKRRPGHYWVEKPLSLTAEGYTRFAHINNFVTRNIFTGVMGLLVGNTRIPAMVDAPLISPEEPLLHHPADEIPVFSHPRDFGIDPLPVIVFSHGMASSRTQYSHYASELASRGYVVACIEHRDGSGPGTAIMQRSPYNDDITVRPLLHFGLSDLTLPSKTAFSEPTLDGPALKRIQLAFRQAEIDETASILKLLNSGHGRQIYLQNARDEGTTLKSWTHRLDTTNMILAGHSYGATGALKSLRAPQQLFKAGIILDPGKSSGPLETEIEVPLLVIHSHSWSRKHSIFHGRPHFDVVRDLVRGVNERGGKAWFMTSLGTSHPSVTDAPLLEPTIMSWTTGSKIAVEEGVRQYVHVSEDFGWWLRTGQRRNLLASRSSSEKYDDDNRGMEKRFRKFWQIHVSPSR